MGCFTACRPAFLLQLVVHSYPACPLNYPPPCLTSASDGLGTPTHLHVTKGGGGIGAIDSEDKRRCGRVAIAAKNCRRHRLGGFFDRIDHDNVSLGAKDQRQSEPECLEFPSGYRRNRLRPGAAFYPHAQWILPNVPLLVPRVCQPTVTRQFGRCAEAANTQ